ncbi:hypothetical protein C0989_008807 [Termitomyces sp. Mn162]|nr:hypothetical protein C0989_008807 [Termitomyces sp. Mn162]
MMFSYSHFGASLLLPSSLKREPSLLLDSIDNILERPLLSFSNPLLAEDKGVPDVDPAFLSFGRYSLIEEHDTLSRPARPPRQIDDELVMRMKRPIDLPAEDYQPYHSTNDYSGLVDATSMMSLASRHHPLSSPRRRHHERASAPDVARYGTTCYSAALSLETPDILRRPRPFGHAH